MKFLAVALLLASALLLAGCPCVGGYDSQFIELSEGRTEVMVEIIER